VGILSQVLLSRPLIQIDEVGVKFTKDRGLFNKRTSSVEAVKSVSFTIGESEIVSIVGESGCGKTTLANCVLALVPLTSGYVRYFGDNLAKFDGHALKQYRRDVQMVFQDPYESLNPRQKVSDIISTPLRYLLGQKDSIKIRETVRSLMNEVGLDPSKFMERLPHQLSGGERQRVSIARALATSPKLLVADEPTTMLDATQRFAILRLLKDLNSVRKLSILLITHDLATAKILGGRIHVMYLGRIVEEGRSDEVLSIPHHPYVELILESTPRLKHTFFAEKPVTTLEESSRITSGCVFRTRCKYSTSICAEVDPRLAEVSPSQFVACHNPLNIGLDRSNSNSSENVAS
jgi:peptide/nickel transport system ATP-binding protein